MSIYKTEKEKTHAKRSIDYFYLSVIEITREIIEIT